MIWRDVLGSRLAVGSSTSRMSGFWMSARAMPTRWRCPPESAFSITLSRSTSAYS